MADLIRLLPDAIANQIAAGEVVQRPASVVKELLENAIDAGSTDIKLIVKDAGKTLIQVNDNGCGMSQTDARMSLERHATSKIREAKDLFSIRTMGFRGEALPSMASIAQLELKSRLQQNELGTRILVEGGKLITQEPCQCPAGTSIAVKNLFFNIPARRNFLKSNSVEMRHILDEFTRVALANPDIQFSLHHNGESIYHLTTGNLRQRIVQLFGKRSNEKLVPLEEDTDIVSLSGYIGKPDFTKKSRGHQFFFVNKRFIKSGHLNHALVNAYDNLIASGEYPFYVIFIEIDPSKIDINVHPTKQEIKFDDERLVYNYLRVTAKHALAQHNIAPSLDFEADLSFKHYEGLKKTDSPSGNPQKSFISGKDAVTKQEKNNVQNWQKLYDGLQSLSKEEQFDDFDISNKDDESITIESKWESTGSKQENKEIFTKKEEKTPYQIHNTYIVSQIKSGFLLIDQQAAHERILYEQYLSLLEEQKTSSQNLLFPKKVEVEVADIVLLKELLPELETLGFQVSHEGSTTFLVKGIPADLREQINEASLFDTLIAQYREDVNLEFDIKEGTARSLAKSAALKRGKKLDPEEMKAIIDQLFACSVPFKSPFGKNCFITFDLEELKKQFDS